jgi:hypothetical protein
MVSIAGMIGGWQIAFSLTVAPAARPAGTRQPKPVSLEEAAALAPAWAKLEARGLRLARVERPQSGHWPELPGWTGRW